MAELVKVQSFFPLALFQRKLNLFVDASNDALLQCVVGEEGKSNTFPPDHYLLFSSLHFNREHRQRD